MRGPDVESRGIPTMAWFAVESRGIPTMAWFA